MFVFLDLTKASNKKIVEYRLINRVNLHDGEEGRATMLIELEAIAPGESVDYSPGDHLAVYPENRKELVDGILKRFAADDVDQMYSIFIKKQHIENSEEEEDKWTLHERLPVTSLRQALTKYLVKLKLAILHVILHVLINFFVFF